MQTLNIKQGTEEWFNARKGVATASRFKDIVTPTKGDLSKTHMRYMYELIAEKMGADTDSFSNKWTERGTELEPSARTSFEFITDLEVVETGMILNDAGTVGISPDGLIGDYGGIEIKCPKASTHVKYLLDGVVPTEYKTQVMGSLWISQRDYWYFMSYHPQIEPLILKVYRDEEYIKNMEKHINFFVEKLEENYKRILNKTRS